MSKLPTRGMPRSVLAVAYNAYIDGDQPASFILPAERRAVRDLAKRGILQITAIGTWRGHREVLAKLTPAAVALAKKKQP